MLDREWVAAYDAFMGKGDGGGSEMHSQVVLELIRRKVRAIEEIGCGGQLRSRLFGSCHLAGIGRSCCRADAFQQDGGCAFFPFLLHFPGACTHFGICVDT